jgi:hypothetical protein
MMFVPSPRSSVLLVSGAGRREARFWNSFADACAQRDVQLFAVFQGGWENERITLEFPHIGTGHGDREFRQFLGSVGPASIPEAIQFLGSLVLSLVRPSVALIWNGFDENQQSWRRFLESAGVRTFVAERAAFPGLFCVDETGLNGLSEFQKEPRRQELRHRHVTVGEHERIQRLLDHVRASRLVSYRSGNEVRAAGIRHRLGLRSGEKLILFVGNWDEMSGVTGSGREVHRAQSPHYESSRAAAASIADTVSKLDGFHVILRPHPLDQSDWSPLADGASAHVAPTAEVTDLIREADVVAGLTSTLLFHAVAHDKPVVLMGRPAFFGYGFSYDLEHPDDLGQLLTSAVSKEGWESRLTPRDRFLAEYLFRYCYTEDDAFLGLGVQRPDTLLDKLSPRGHGAELSPGSLASLQELGLAVQTANRRTLELQLYVEEVENRAGDGRIFFRAQVGRLLRVLTRFPVLARALSEARRRWQRIRLK